MSIPKIIHQTWKTKEIPKELVFCVESWSRLNPGWEYKLWTDVEMDSFVKKEFPEIYSTYVEYPAGIFRADLFRLLVVYKMGGVYVDLDMECIKSLDYLIKTFIKDKDLAFSFEPPAQSKIIFNINQLYAVNFLITKPNNEIIYKMISCIAQNEIIKNDIIKTTGPVAITKCLNGLLLNEGVVVLDWKVVNPIIDITNKDMQPFYIRQSLKMCLEKKYYPETCMVHYWDGTYWKNDLSLPSLLFFERCSLIKKFKYLENPIFFSYELFLYFVRRVFLKKIYKVCYILKNKTNC